MDIQILIGILIFTMAAFVFEWLPIDVVALTCLALLLLFDLVTPEEAIAGFGNTAVITVMMMFVLSEALTHSGVISKLGHRIASMSGSSYWIAGVALLLVCGVLSAFVSNTATLAILMPLGIQLAKHFDVSTSKVLLPLSYISIVGGTCTVIGTSTNLIVSSLAVEHGLAEIGMFEFLWLGGLLFLIGLVYVVLVPLRFLPDRRAPESLTSKYELEAFLTELEISEGSKLVGRTVLNRRISERFRLNVLQILRKGATIGTDLRVTELEAGDRLIVRGAMRDIVGFREQYGLLMLTDIKLSDELLTDQKNILAEVQISPVSRLVDLTIREIDFRRRFGCFVLALNRTGEVIRDKLTSIPLRNWDTLLVFGPRSRVEALFQLEDFVSLEEVNIRLHLPRNWWLATVTIPVVVVAASLGFVSILEAAILGAVAMVVTRTITIQQAYQSINWTVIFLLAAILPLGTAMENTGLNTVIADLFTGLGAGLSEGGSTFVVLSIIYLTTTLLSEAVSNNSTAVLMVPIALSTANSLGHDPKAFLMTVAFAASASFLTPMGYQTNAMVFGPGGYRFSDYLLWGLPLKIIFWIVSVALIPYIWPL